MIVEIKSTVVVVVIVVVVVHRSKATKTAFVQQVMDLTVTQQKHWKHYI